MAIEMFLWWVQIASNCNVCQAVSCPSWDVASYNNYNPTVVFITSDWKRVFVVGWVARSKKRLRVSGIQPSPPTCWGGWYSNEKIHGCWSSKSSHQKIANLGIVCFFSPMWGQTHGFLVALNPMKNSHHIPVRFLYLALNCSHKIAMWSIFAAELFFCKQTMPCTSQHARLTPPEIPIRCPSPRGYTWNGTPNSWRIFPIQNPSMDEKWG